MHQQPNGITLHASSVSETSQQNGGRYHPLHFCLYTNFADRHATKRANIGQWGGKHNYTHSNVVSWKSLESRKCKPKKTASGC